MNRERFGREYKLGMVKEFRDRGVASALVVRELGIDANVVSRWAPEARLSV